MSRVSVTSKCSRRQSNDGSTDGTSAQSAHTNEQPPPEQDPVQSIDDEEINGNPSVGESSSEILNSGPPQPSKPRGQENTFNDSPKGPLALEENKNVAREDQPTLSDIMKVVEQVFDVLKDSTIASKTGKDNRSRFWAAHKKVAGEHDDEFLERYYNDMDIVLVFSGLFSAVSSAFIVAMESNLSPDPNITTHALLTQLVQIGLGNFTAAGSTPAAPASEWSPPIASIRIQSIAYASLSFSLLAAFGAVLGKQWLGYYKSHRYGRGSEDERGKRRQEKFDGIVAWHFDAVVQSFPILLQFSLFLFGIALSANMWCEQHTIAWVIIAATVFGFLFYSLTIMAALVSPACPFQTPVSTILRMLHVDKVLHTMVELTSLYLQKLATSAQGVLLKGLSAPLRRLLMRQYRMQLDRLYRSRFMRWIRFKLAGSVSLACSFVRRCRQRLSDAFHHLPPWRHSLTSVVDSEAQVLDQSLDIVATDQYQYPLKLELPDIPISNLEAPSIMWLIETSTDPEVFHAAASLVPDVDWPLHLDVSGTLHQLYDAYTTCLDVRGQIIPSLENKASACTMALCHLYCHRILQGRPACGFRGEGHADVYVFQEMSHRTKVNYDVFAATNNLFVTNYEESHYPLSSLEFGACPDSVPLLEWLSRVLPFYFVTGGMSEVGKELAITVISKILCSPSPPPQIMANCTLLACVMVGVQFDKKDVVRIDKSSALHELAWSLWTQFEKVWTSDRGHPLLDKYNMGIRQEWILLDTICRMNELDIISPILSHMMWVVGVCRKIYSWARSSQHNDSTSALVKVQCFRFTIESSQDGPYPTEPAWLWNHQIAWQGDPHSPEDFDWLVDYLGDVCSNDYETAGDILVLLNSMGVSCSPAKQRLYIEKLIACMGSNMPPRLRHAALYAAHIFREVLTFIDVVDDADVILTNLSHSILTAVRPRPGATPTYDSVIWNAIPTNDDDPDFFFHRDRDRRYLELIFSLARNSHWRPHLHCQIDRAIGMIAICCNLDDWHAYFLVGFFCQMTSEEVSATSLSSITEQQWWDMIRLAWNLARYTTDDTHGVEFLLVLVERTKKHMRFTSIYYLEQLIYNVDAVIGELEKCLLEQKEAVADAMKELKGMAKDMLIE